MATTTPTILGDGVPDYLQAPNTKLPLARNHLATLDGLRGLAALSVLLIHVMGEMHLRASSRAVPLDQLVPHVHLAVDFFFMLSGYVIAKAYEAKLVTTMSFSQFMSVRLARLYPLIFMGAALGAFSLAIRVVVAHTPSPGQLLTATLSALVILPTTALLSVFPGELFPINLPEWSLLFELLINVVYAAIVRWLSISRLIAICVISFVFLCWVAASSDRLLDIGMGLQPVGIIPADIWCGFIRVTFPFFLGILLFRRRFSWSTGTAASIILSLVFLAVLFVPVFPHSWAYEVMVVALVFPVVLLIGATCKTAPKLNKLFIALGELSYPLYVTHNPVTRIFINVLKTLHIRLPNAVAIVLCGLSAVIAAIVFLKWWDRPVRNWLSLRVRRPAPGVEQRFSAT
jgi:peptidoglycan/LPS O-acetylase OafA/YrhL